VKCTNCGVEKSQRDGQWWHLCNYYGIRGTFCPDCYELVSHDPYGAPNHPAEYQQIKEKQ
jgi:hypothetical protein